MLYPDEGWDVLALHDNESSLRRYDRDYDLSAKAFVTSPSVPLAELVALAWAYIERITQRNSRLMIALMQLPPLRYFPSLTLYLEDVNMVVTFGIRHGLRASSLPPAECHATLGSESLAYAFRHDWGYETLEVNGRFRATPAGHRRMVKGLFLGPLNNTGRYLRPSMVLDARFLERALAKIRQLG